MDAKEIFVKLFNNKGKDEIRGMFGHDFYQQNRYLLSGRKGSFDRFIHFITQIHECLTRKEGKLLDVGCGFGLHSMVLTKLGYDVFSLDVSLKKIEVHNALISSYDKQIPCCPILGDATCLPMEDESMDVIYVNEFISHVPDLLKSIKEFRRVLKTGGDIIISDTDRRSLFFNLIMLFGRRSVDKRYKRMRRKIIEEFLKRRESSLRDEEIEAIASKTAGMIKSEIEEIIRKFLNGINIESLIERFKLREPFGREFKHRSPYGQYSERVFTPSEVTKLLENDFTHLRSFYPLMSSPLAHLASYGAISILEKAFSKSPIPFLLIGKYVVHGVKRKIAQEIVPVS